MQSVTWDDLARMREQGDDQTKNYQVPPELIELARANRKGRGSVGTLTPVAPRPVEAVPVVVPGDAATPTVDSEAVVEGLSAPPVACEELTPSAVARVAVESAIVARGSSRDDPGAAPSIDVDSELYPLEELAEEEPSVARLGEPDAVAADVAASPASQPQPSRLREYAPILTGAAIVGAYVTLCYLANALFSALP